MPQNGQMKLYKELKCPLDNFELSGGNRLYLPTNDSVPGLGFLAFMSSLAESQKFSDRTPEGLKN